MKKTRVFFGSIIKNIWFCIKSCFNASKKYFLIKCVFLLFNTAIPFVTMWFWREILNRLTKDIEINKNIILFCLIAYLSLNLFINLVNRFDTYINIRYNDELTFYIESVMIEKTSRMDLSFFDSASMGDKINIARNNFNTMNRMTWLVFSIISAIINIITAFVIVTAYNFWIGIATLVLLIPFFWYNKKHSEKLLKMEKEQIRDNRKIGYYSGVFFNNEIQFEIKLNNIGEYFIEKYKETWSKLYKINKSEDIRHNIISGFLLILNMVSELLVFMISIFDVINKRIGIGDMQYNFSMVSRLREQTSSLINLINELFISNVRLIELQDFIALKPEFEKSGQLIPSTNPRIEFCNVSFNYPNSEQLALKNCSFIIEPYEKIGLIGLNGSGKSTIIKLILRFYDPQKGIIKIDGIDLKEYNIYAVRKIFGILFQDNVTYCLPFREIVAFSDFGERFNDKKIKKVCDISGVSNIIKDWEQGYDSVLGRYYSDNGKDFSGGQWQLVGLARAYFKDSSYMILDEPSASLDPISEDRIFEQLYRLDKSKNSVTISHRLSNTALADKILVINDGQIIEQGSHFELLKQNGQYARLFNLEAKKYQ